MPKSKRVSFNSKYEKLEYSVTCLYKIENKTSSKTKFCNKPCLFNYCNDHILLMNRNIF